MVLAETKLRSWRDRLNAAKQKVSAVADEIQESGDMALISRLKDADCYLDDAVNILLMTIEAIRLADSGR